MSTQMIIRLDVKTKRKLSQMAQAEGKNTIQVVRELIENYIQERDIGAYIDDLWDRVGKKFKARNTTITDIEQAIRNVRASKR